MSVELSGLHARRDWNSPHLNRSAHDGLTDSSNNNPRPGYGGISEKISRLNDILRSLEAKRCSNTVVNYNPGNNCASIWPPNLCRNSAGRVLEGRVNLERSCSQPCTSRDRVRERPAGGSVLEEHAGGSVLEKLRQHELHIINALQSKACTPRASTIASAHAEGRSSIYNPGFVSCSPTRSIARRLDSPRFINAYYHDACKNYKPGPEFPSIEVDGAPSIKKGSAPTADTIHKHESGESFSKVTEMAHEILARLERLELQQIGRKRSVNKKGSVRKLDRKLARQYKKHARGSFGERGLLQAVRRRARNGDLYLREDAEVSARQGAHADRNALDSAEETDKRLQRLETEMELCWSAINQLCIDNELFREEQRRWGRQSFPPSQWTEAAGHAKLNNNNKNKDDKCKKRGCKSIYDQTILANDSSA